MFEFTKRAKKILEVIAQGEAKRLNSDILEPEHVLIALISDEDSVAARIMKNLNISFDELRDEIEKGLTSRSSAIVLGRIPIGPRYKKVIDLARDEARKLKNSYIGTEHLLLAIFKDGNCAGLEMLKKAEIDYNIIRNEILRVLGVKIVNDGSVQQNKQQGKGKTIDEFAVELTCLAKQQKLDPVIGRDREISRMIRILSRKRKNNPILIGEAGVGKTAIVEGLAQRIVDQEVPESLKDCRVYSLDMASIVAGTKYRGEFEERLKKLIKDISAQKDLIIFIDEIHSIIGAGAAEGAIDAANILKPALARGELQCIGATTLNEYKQHIEKDAALVRRFQALMVEEPEIGETIRILHGLRKTYEQHHHVRYLDETISRAAYLADRYVNDRYMPDKAIDLLDEAGSMARLENISKPVDILALEEEVEELNRQKNERVLHQEYEQAAAIRDLIQEKKDYLKEKLESWYNKTDEYTIVVGPQKVAAVVAESTGVPVENIEEEEGERLLRMEENMGKRIIGQVVAIRAITRAIKRSRIGLKRRNTPRGSFIFLGPTGVGKTEMAKALTEFLFDSQKNLIRLDMSEYMERHSVSKLVGSPPGYIGYDEGGQLTERIRRHPYSVILFDEIEKAHPDVFNILLQVMEEGEMTDSGGTTVSFRDTVIILTSNVGNSSFQKGGPPGFASSDEGDRRYELVEEEVRRLFAPEFLNRIDEVVYFRSLDRSDISRILDLLLEEVNDRLKERDIQLECTSGVKKFLIDTGFDEKFGARNLRRVVQRELEDTLVDDLLSGKIGGGCFVQALKKGNSIRFRELKERTESPELVSSKSDS